MIVSNFDNDPQQSLSLNCVCVDCSSLVVCVPTLYRGQCTISGVVVIDMESFVLSTMANQMNPTWILVVLESVNPIETFLVFVFEIFEYTGPCRSGSAISEVIMVYSLYTYTL